MSRVGHHFPPLVIGLGLIVVALPLSACARKAEIVLHQPLAPPSQQALKLVGDWAYHAADGHRAAYTLAFPLPGSADGPRAFVMYISVPNPNNPRVDPQDPDGVKGFLIQELGALAGRGDFVSGTLQCRRVLFAPRLYRLDLNLRCDDGTEISGQAIVEDLPRQVQVFEREFAADIARLSVPPAQPPDSPGETNDQREVTGGAGARAATVP